MDILYKFTEKKQVQQWQIIVDGDKFYTIEGIQGGKLTTSLPTLCKGKNIGKKNETTPESQAHVEAAAKHQKKLDKGYNAILTTEKNFRAAMLANEAKKGDQTIFKTKVFVQPKLDGLRAINEENKLTSRNGKEFIVGHLCQAEVVLDGELYTHEYHDDFNAICSLVKRKTRTEEEQREMEEKLEYWVYDLPEFNGTFSRRYEVLTDWLKKINNPMFRLVPTYEVKSWDEIDEWHGRFLEGGFEGTIIRLDLGPYEGKRSKQLLKYKDFTDEEFEIIGAEEGEGGRAGTLGKFFMKHDKDERANFKSNVKGNHKYLKFLWDNKAKYLGKTATVKYFNRTPAKADGTGDKPRFPYIIKIDRDEYE